MELTQVPIATYIIVKYIFHIYTIYVYVYMCVRILHHTYIYIYICIHTYVLYIYTYVLYIYIYVLYIYIYVLYVYIYIYIFDMHTCLRNAYAVFFFKKYRPSGHNSDIHLYTAHTPYAHGGLVGRVYN